MECELDSEEKEHDKKLHDLNYNFRSVHLCVLGLIIINISVIATSRCIFPHFIYRSQRIVLFSFYNLDTRFFIRTVRTYIQRLGTYPTKQHRLLWRRWSTGIMNPGVPPAEECGAGLPSVDSDLAKDGKQILRAPVKLNVTIGQNQEYRQPYTGG